MSFAARIRSHGLDYGGRVRGAGVAKPVDARDLKSLTLRYAGSSPAARTILKMLRNPGSRCWLVAGGETSGNHMANTRIGFAVPWPNGKWIAITTARQPRCVKKHRVKASAPDFPGLGLFVLRPIAG